MKSGKEYQKARQDVSWLICVVTIGTKRHAMRMSSSAGETSRKVCNSVWTVSRVNGMSQSINVFVSTLFNKIGH